MQSVSAYLANQRRVLSVRFSSWSNDRSRPTCWEDSTKAQQGTKFQAHNTEHCHWLSNNDNIYAYKCCCSCCCDSAKKKTAKSKRKWAKIGLLRVRSNWKLLFPAHVPAHESHRRNKCLSLCTMQIHTCTSSRKPEGLARKLIVLSPSRSFKYSAKVTFTAEYQISVHAGA